LLSELSTKEDIADVLLLYRDFSNQPNIADAISLEDQQPSLGVQFGERRDDSDPGVEIESSMSPTMLADNLGFPRGLPLLFNKYRNRNGLSPWDSDSAHLFDDDAAHNNEDMIPFVPHWHQLAGAHALFRKVFNSAPNEHACTGMLIADDVGLGKTCQATMVIAALTDAVQLQNNNKSLPPLLSALLSAIFLSLILTT
jgi:TATA-binding protein-associated factor